MIPQEPIAVIARRVLFSDKIWYWRGPAPFYFVTVPDDVSRDIHTVASAVTYGWGMIPVTVTIGSSTWQTSFWPKNGSYVVPIKAAVRRAEKIGDGDTVAISLELVAAPRW